MSAATHCWRDWSCTVRVVVADARVLTAACAEVRALMASVDAAASRFRPDSALSLANRNAGRPVPVPRLLTDLVDVALTAARDTDGAVDPCLGAHLAAQGYDADIAAVRDTDVGVRPVPPVRPGAWRAVRLDRTAGLLTVPRGAALDLGATAKARTADLAADRIAARWDTATLVELGGDVAVRGAEPWRVRVAERADGVGQVVRLSGGGLATSTTTLRRWSAAGRACHHLLDPATGRPCTGPWRTASVAAGSATAANVASTAAIVLGERAEEWLRRRGLSARLVGTDGGVVAVGGWPAEALAGRAVAA